MKKLLTALLALGCLVFFAACGAGEDGTTTEELVALNERIAQLENRVDALENPSAPADGPVPAEGRGPEEPAEDPAGSDKLDLVGLIGQNVNDVPQLDDYSHERIPVTDEAMYYNYSNGVQLMVYSEGGEIISVGYYSGYDATNGADSFWTVLGITAADTLQTAGEKLAVDLEDHFDEIGSGVSGIPTYSVETDAGYINLGFNENGSLMKVTISAGFGS